MLRVINVFLDRVAEDAFSFFALAANSIALGLTVGHFLNVGGFRWPHHQVITLEYVQVFDQTVSIVLLSAVLMWWSRNRTGVLLRTVCALLCAISVFLELWLMPNESEHGSEALIGPTIIVAMMALTAFSEVMAAITAGLFLAEATDNNL